MCKCKGSIYLRLNGRMIKCLSKPKIPKQMKPWRKKKIEKATISKSFDFFRTEIKNSVPNRLNVYMESIPLLYISLKMHFVSTLIFHLDLKKIYQHLTVHHIKPSRNSKELVKLML